MPDAGAARIVAACLARGLTIGTGESLTAGLVAATLAEVPGCSAVLRGGVIAYQADVKQALLDVAAADLDHGVVSRQVAVAMAVGAARTLGCDLGIATTGVAGPDAHEGEPVGSVWIAAAAPGVVRSRHLMLAGDRQAIRCQTVVSCWELLAEVLDELAEEPAEGFRE